MASHICILDYVSSTWIILVGLHTQATTADKNKNTQKTYRSHDNKGITQEEKNRKTCNTSF
jgi:hypothetical protein